MSSHIQIGEIAQGKLREIWSVREFVRENDLDEKTEKQLLALFGSFATKQELVANLERRCRTR
ncbi:hypothetical protein [Rhizobium sp. RAF56]|uniref:hypothetical protein n=1 Tax=Rhizobium sp. RAF56 TaxID=3233062 RepID=UPI003F945791